MPRETVSPYVCMYVLNSIIIAKTIPFNLSLLCSSICEFISMSFLADIERFSDRYREKQTDKGLEWQPGILSVSMHH